MVTFALLLTSALWAGCSGGGDDTAVIFPDSLVDDEMIVTVNTERVMGRDVRVFTMVYQSTSQDSLGSRVYNLDLLNGYIDRMLLQQEARAFGLTVDDSTASWFINEFYNSLGGRARLLSILAKAGIEESDIKETIRRDLLVRMFIEQQISTTITVSEADARAFYDGNPQRFQTPDSVRARHIILTLDPVDDAAAIAEKRNRLKSWRDEVRAGASFPNLARQHSQGPSAPSGGDLGYFTFEAMVPEFSRAAFAMKPGEVSDVITTSFGYHILYLEDRTTGENLEFEAVKQTLMQQMSDRDMLTTIETHLVRSRSVATIVANFDLGGLTQRESATLTR